MSDMIENLPAIALRGTTILPDMIVHFDVSREKSIKAIEKAMVQDQRIFLITQRDPEVEEPVQEDLYRIGTIAEIKQLVKTKNNMIQVLVEGKERAELLRFEENTNYLDAEIALFQEEHAEDMDENLKEAMIRGMKELFIRYCNENPKLSKDLANQILEQEEVQKVIDQIAVNLPMRYEDKQKILDAVTLEERYEVLGMILSHEIEIMQIRVDLNQKVKQRVDKNQRDYILREQLKVIREELGDQDTVSEADQFREQVEKLKASKEVKEKIKKEIDRFKNTAGSQAEASVMRSYIETLLSLPWDKTSRDNKNLKKAKEILEEDHYGLEKVKERIMEFLAVRTLTKKGDSPILCLAGPPGTGKTSIARSVARALGKEYVRMSLGGVRDEAEIRGHRRTYIGAMPGRIANGLIQAGVKNPLMLLDEIDKVSSDYKGDTSSALLEVLDSEQNNKFADHYVELPIDLSEVLFIATANDPQAIPRPLLDRMEVIEISSYTENEKLHIAEEHLIPKQIEKHGLTPKQITFSKHSIWKIARNYTKEAGVRQLEREIGNVCRKAAKEIFTTERKKIAVTDRNIHRFLGKEKYTYQMANIAAEVGIVRGLAWTSVGGDTLQIEVNVMPGKGELMLTGQLGDVMKESARTGISYIRSISESQGISEDFFEKHDIHIHIPEGAVPKDGPSAGITMATAIFSAVTERKIRADLAMTGEITLRGRVLPIGGLKEKLLAAKTAGMKKVLVPSENRSDVEEFDEEITGGMEIVFVSEMKQVLEHALVPGNQDK